MEQGDALPEPNDSRRDKPDNVNRSNDQPSASGVNLESPLSMKQFATPILLDKSLWGLFASPDQSLMDLCTQASIPVTFNANLFLDHSRNDSSKSMAAASTS